MKSVILHLDGAAFHEELCAIRDWLNDRGYSAFRYEYYWLEPTDDVVHVRLDFRTPSEAQVFCARFRGELAA